MQLSGEQADLAFLAETFIGRDINVSKEGEAYFLSSLRFEGLGDANAVRDTAVIVGSILNGVCRVALNGAEPVGIGNGIYRDGEGKSHYYLFADTGVIRLRGIPETLAKLLEGSSESEAVKKWALLALGDSEVAKVLRINAFAPLDWVNLYRILEIIQKDVGGLKVIATSNWMSRNSISLFKHTADSADVLGLEARHGVQRTEPPSKPMSIGEARKLIRTLTWHWLLSKG